MMLDYIKIPSLRLANKFIREILRVAVHLELLDHFLNLAVLIVDALAVGAAVGAGSSATVARANSRAAGAAVKSE